MSVQIGTGESTGNNRPVRTSAGVIYVVMENAGSIEVWREGENLTYYADASISGPTDAQGVWTDDADAFDGNDATFATTDDEISGLDNRLIARGTNAPTSNGSKTIHSVRGRFKGNNVAGTTNAQFLPIGGGGSTQPFYNGTSPGFSSYQTLNAPGGSWSWSGLSDDYEVRLSASSGGSGHEVYIIEFNAFVQDTTKAFTQMDAAGSPACMADSPIGVAIDSDDRLHICYVAGSASAEDLDYVTFDTVDSTAGDDLFNTPEEAINMEDADNSHWGCGIAVDSNDIPHACVIGTDANMGTDYHTLYYDNKIGGSWADRREIAGVSETDDIWTPDIAINGDNYPVISYHRTSVQQRLEAVLGDANDPTSFAYRDIAGATISSTSICVDSNGDAWVAYVSFGGAISIAKQSANWTDAWSVESNGNDGTEPSIVVDSSNDDIYVVYEEDISDDIVYDKWDGAAWLDETLLQSSVAYNSVKARWSFLNLASLQTYGIDYIFQRDSDGVILWDVLDISPAEDYVPQIMMMV